MNTITAISSKSYVHRLLIAAALCDKKVRVDTNIISNDMEATKRVVSALFSQDDPVLDCGESGSTARFIIPLAALFSKSAKIIGSGKLPERPMGPLCDVLTAAGVTVNGNHLPITVSGKPHSGNYSIAGNVSSQFISGLLFMLPLLEGDSHLEITGTLESAPYVDMTIDVLSRFSIVVNRTVDGFDIPGGQKYVYDGKEGGVIAAEGDWSNSAYIMTIASLGSGTLFDSLAVEGLNPDSLQGDRAVIPILEKFGINVSMSKSTDPFSTVYEISGRPVNPVDTDCSQIPDLVPALAMLAAFTNGNSIFRNVGRLRMKECDRIEAVSAMLSAISVKVDIISTDSREDMIVCGRAQTGNESVVIDSFNDHRIAMAAAAIAAAHGGSVTIKGAEAVNKSYPGFFDTIEKLGIVRADSNAPT